MKIEVIPQLELGTQKRVRIGDILNSTIADSFCQQFRFAVAYMRVSGLDRLAASIDTLLNRGGSVSGAVGIDGGITTIEALEALQHISLDSTIFYTISGFIYHPKLYLMSGTNQALVLIGSANLTRDGLFRNVELATTVYLDFHLSEDMKVYNRYELFINELHNAQNPNVQFITKRTLITLANAGMIKHEAEVWEPGPILRSRRTTPITNNLQKLFPQLQVPVAPPGRSITAYQKPTRVRATTPPKTVGVGSTFIMQLSPFDSSHRTGVPGTPEILIPHAAINFFPRLSRSNRKYPDVLFDVVLNTTTGQQRHQFRLWYYEERAIGTRIDEYRLRMDHDTIDLCTPGGGDLLVMNRLLAGNDPAYEVTILPQVDPTFPAFLSLCKNEIRGKKWGLT